MKALKLFAAVLLLVAGCTIARERADGTGYALNVQPIRIKWRSWKAYPPTFPQDDGASVFDPAEP